MEKIHILGHDNTSLSVILEVIHQQFGGSCEVIIVSNLPENENPQKDYPFHHPGLRVKKIFHDEWTFTGKEAFVLGSMGTNVRKKVYDFFSQKFDLKVDQFINLIHPFSSIGQGVAMKGVTVNPGVVVAPYTELKDFSYLNRNCSIGHHTVLEEFVSINPGAVVNGKCRIGKFTTIGAGAVVNDGVSVGSNCIIGSGSVVTKDIPDGMIAFGSPAKPIKENPRIFEM